MKDAGIGFPLNTSVLVLNRFYMAVHVVTAVTDDIEYLSAIEEGQYVNYDFGSWCEISEFRALEKMPDDDWVRTVSIELQVPRVIRLYRYDRVPKQSLRFNRRNLFARDEHRCQYCGGNFPSNKLSFDHVIPRSRGGPTDWNNVVCACVACNTRKGGRTPQEARMKLIKKPTKPKYSPVLASKLNNPKFQSWRSFVTSSSWAMDAS